MSGPQPKLVNYLFLVNKMLIKQISEPIGLKMSLRKQAVGLLLLGNFESAPFLKMFRNYNN